MPYWRSKLWRRVANNVTTVSHVYACWVTVGFFYCDSSGALTQVDGDWEVGGTTNNLRHRGLFVLDRSGAAIASGSNLWAPGGVTQPVKVVYRRIVESKRGGW